jgi:hypothetical protein
VSNPVNDTTSGSLRTRYPLDNSSRATRLNLDHPLGLFTSDAAQQAKGNFRQHRISTEHLSILEIAAEKERIQADIDEESICSQTRELKFLIEVGILAGCCQGWNQIILGATSE